MNNNSGSRGIGFCGCLELIFIVLKLLNKIDWSWWWVFSPTWIPLSILLIALFAWKTFTILRAIWKQRHCILHGHNYETKVEYRELTYGMSSRPVTRCTRCGKIKPKEVTK